MKTKQGRVFATINKHLINSTQVKKHLKNSHLAILFVSLFLLTDTASAAWRKVSCTGFAGDTGKRVSVEAQFILDVDPDREEGEVLVAGFSARNQTGMNTFGDPIVATAASYEYTPGTAGNPGNLVVNYEDSSDGGAKWGIEMPYNPIASDTTIYISVANIMFKMDKDNGRLYQDNHAYCRISGMSTSGISFEKSEPFSKYRDAWKN